MKPLSPLWRKGFGVVRKDGQSEIFKKIRQKCRKCEGFRLK